MPTGIFVCTLLISYLLSLIDRLSMHLDDSLAKQKRVLDSLNQELKGKKELCDKVLTVLEKSRTPRPRL